MHRTTERKPNRFLAWAKHAVRLHAWVQYGTFVADGAQFTQQRCTRCDKTRVNRLVMDQKKFQIDKLLSAVWWVRDKEDGTEKLAIIVESEGEQVALVMSENTAQHLSDEIWHGKFNKDD